jgi:hypothetical protein
MLQFLAIVTLGAMGFAIYNQVEKRKADEQQLPPTDEDAEE